MDGDVTIQRAQLYFYHKKRKKKDIFRIIIIYHHYPNCIVLDDETLKAVQSSTTFISTMSQKTPGSGSLKDLDKKRREVFKPILDNPFTKGTSWPEVPNSVSKDIMEYLLQLLSSYGQYIQVKKTRKDHSIEPHELENKITIGFNSTVRKLEEQAAPNREKILKSNEIQTKKEDTTNKHYVKYVFVAKSDITTPLLTSCFPLLTFSASKSLEDRVKLVELPRGAQEKLLKVLNVENVNILSFSSDWVEGAPLFKLIDANIVDVRVPWLEALFTHKGALDMIYQNPDIRFLKTSAPIGKPKVSQKAKKRGPAKEEDATRKKPKVDKRSS